MAAPNLKRHLYYEHQQPAEEPEEPGRSHVVQTMFSRLAPTSEDEYFYEKERKLTHKMSVEPPKLADEPGSIWQKVWRAFTRRADTGWRP